MLFIIYFPSLLILITSFYIGNEKLMYFSVFCPKRLNCPSNSSASSFMRIVMVIVTRSIMKNYKNFFSYTIHSIAHAMRSTSIFRCIMIMVPDIATFFIFSLFIFKFFFSNIANFCIFHDFCCSFVNNFNFFIPIACFCKDSKVFYMQSLPLYTSCLFSMLLNVNIVDIEKLD